MLSVLNAKKKRQEREHNKETLGGVRLIMVTISLGLAYVQTHQIVCIKYVQLFVYHFYFNKIVFLKN